VNVASSPSGKSALCGVFFTVPQDGATTQIGLDRNLTRPAQVREACALYAGAGQACRPPKVHAGLAYWQASESGTTPKSATGAACAVSSHFQKAQARPARRSHAFCGKRATEEKK